MNYDIDESVMDLQILKLTLQPIVENAIYHGLKWPKEGVLIYQARKKTGLNLLSVIMESA